MDSAQSAHGFSNSFSSTSNPANMQNLSFEQDPASLYAFNVDMPASEPYAYTGSHFSPATTALGGYDFNMNHAQPGPLLQHPSGPMGTARYMPSAGCGTNLYQPLPLNSTYAPSEDATPYQHLSTNFEDVRAAPYGSFPGVNGTPPYPGTDPEYESHYNDDEGVDYSVVNYQQQSRDFPRASPAALHIHGFDSASSYVPGSSETDHANVTALSDNDDSFQPIQSSNNKRKIAQPRSRKLAQKTLTPPSSSASQTPPTQQVVPAERVTGLIYNGFADAEAVAYNRSRLNINNDDWQHVKTRPAEHVQKLVAAFYAQYGDVPENQDLTQADQARWLSYQETHTEKMSKFTDEQIEAACWVLLKNILECHEIGVKRMRYHRNDYIEKCSTHVERVANAIALYAVVRYDVVRLQRFDELVSSTNSAVQRKISNFRGNWGKTKREMENNERAKEAGFEYKKVLGEKKRKAEEEPAEPRPKRRTAKKAAADDLLQRIEATIPPKKGRGKNNA